MDIEAGGFDEGQGESNVSKSAEQENLVRRVCVCVCVCVCACVRVTV